MIRGIWVAQSVEHLTLDFGSDHNLRVMGSSPASCSALGGACSGFFLSLSKKKKRKETMIIDYLSLFLRVRDLGAAELAGSSQAPRGCGWSVSRQPLTRLVFLTSVGLSLCSLSIFVLWWLLPPEQVATEADRQKQQILYNLISGRLPAPRAVCSGALRPKGRGGSTGAGVSTGLGGGPRAWGFQCQPSTPVSLPPESIATPRMALTTVKTPASWKSDKHFIFFLLMVAT